MSAVIKENHMKYGGKRYFKPGGNMITIRTFGSKRTPTGQANYLEAHNEIPAPKLNGRLTNPTIVEIDTVKTSKGNFLANISNFMGIFGLSGNAAWSKVSAGQYKFLHVGIQMGDLKEAYNQSPKSRNEFADISGKERAVCEVFIVLETSEAVKVANSANFGLEVSGGVLNLTASGGASGSRTTKVSISPGTVYAYMLAKPDWKNSKSEIKSFSDDQHGLF